MKTANVIFKEDRYNYSTSINGTDEEIRSYFIGTPFNFGDNDWNVPDDIQVPVDCTITDREAIK